MAAIALVLAFAPAGARAGMIEGDPIAVCVRRDAPGLTAAALFPQPGGFDCRTPQHRFGAGDYWVLSQPLPDMTGRHGLSVRFAGLWQHAVTLHVLYADGAIRQTGFTSADAGRHLLLGNTISLIPPHHDARPVRLLWHVRGAAGLRGIVLGAALADHGGTADREVLLAAFYGGFAGLALALVVYNLALWPVLRQRFQPAYCVMVLTLLGYALSSSGALGQLVPALDNNDRYRITTVLLGCAGAAALGFARSFFEPRVFAGAFGLAARFVGAGVIGVGLLDAFAAPAHFALLDRLTSAGFVVLLALVPVILWRAWRLRSNYLWIFALAWGAPILLAGLRVASSLGLIAWSFWLDQSTVISMALEAVISSLAVAYRILLVIRERDRARAQEHAARLLADTDPLTGLLNRRAFLSRAIGREGAQTLFVVDLDHFKQVNETIGHDGGDEVLRIVAAVLARTAGDGPGAPLVARFGGEEFVVVAAAGAIASGAVLIDAVREAVLPFDMTVTASAGSSTGPLLREADWKALYRRADEALFAAKAAGRDRARDAAPIALAA